jgi:hypothetical protein
MDGFPDGHVTDYATAVDAASNDSCVGGGGFRVPVSGPRIFADRHPGARRRIARRPDALASPIPDVVPVTSATLPSDPEPQWDLPWQLPTCLSRSV